MIGLISGAAPPMSQRPMPALSYSASDMTEREPLTSMGSALPININYIASMLVIAYHDYLILRIKENR